jgi:hypothetical protein
MGVHDLRMSIVRCPDCGADVTDEVAYCFACFKHVSSTPPEPPQEVEAQQRRKKRIPRPVRQSDHDDGLVVIEEPPTQDVEPIQLPAEAVPQPVKDNFQHHVQELEKIFESFKEISEKHTTPDDR